MEHRDWKTRVLAPDLERDIDCAARSRAPVLITATDDTSTWLAELICQRSGAPPDTIVEIDASEDPEEAEQELRRRAAPRQVSARPVTLLIKGLHRSERFVQRRLRELLSAEGTDRPRIIAASAANLLDEVRSGAFDELLFYRLNVLHLVVDGSEARAGDEGFGTERGAGSTPRGSRDRLARHPAERVQQFPGDRPGAAAADRAVSHGHHRRHLARRPGDERFVGS